MFCGVLYFFVVKDLSLARPLLQTRLACGLCGNKLQNLQFHEAKVIDPELKTSPTVNDMDAWANSIWIRSLDVDRDIERRIRSEKCIFSFFLSSFFQKKSMFQFFPVFFF